MLKAFATFLCKTLNGMSSLKLEINKETIHEIRPALIVEIFNLMLDEL